MVHSEKFQSAQQFEVREESAAQEPDIRVLKLDGTGMQVETFAAPSLKERGRGEYTAVKKKFGAIAATDPDRHSKNRKDSRFAMNELLRGPLAVEEEERRTIEEKVRTRVAAVTEEASTRAQAEGYQAGLQKGFDEAYAKTREECAEQVARFEALLTGFENAKQDIFAANERFVVDLTYRIAGMIALKEIKQDPEYLIRLCRELLERVGVRENIRVRVNARQLKAAAALKAGLEAQLGTLQNFSVETSEDAQDEGCHLETDWNSIDATFERQLAGIRAALIPEEAAN
jgi:flagellar biosynthesis/type III secretory pathway protein FliH